MQALLTAFKYLTVWGCFSANEPAPESIGKAAAYFPLVGLFLGLLLAFSNYVLAPHLDPRITTVVIISLLFAATGGRNLDEVKETFDALAVRSPKTKVNGAVGLVAIVLLILFKSAAIDSMDELLSLSLLLAPVLARWTLLLSLFGYSTRFPDSVRLISDGVKFWPLFVSTAAVLTLTIYFLGRKGLWIALIVSLFSLIMRSLLYRHHAALSRANLGTVVELAEALSLVSFASS
jgi:adenosylcobinamide-GDP ribazoletransferase